MMSVFGWQSGAAAWVAAGVALLVSVAGQWVARRWRRGLSGVCAVAALAGWAVMAPGGWREVVSPRGPFDHLLVPAAVLAVAGLLRDRVRTRWLAVGGAMFAAWWLAQAGVARPEFWRVLFGGLAVAWALTWAGAGETRRGMAVALTLLGAMLAGGAGWLWTGMALVLAGGLLGLLPAGKGAHVPPVLLMMGLVAGELGAGRLMRGGVGYVDLALLGAVGVPFAVPWAERACGRRKGLAVILAPILAAASMLGMAWVVFRVLKSY